MNVGSAIVDGGEGVTDGDTGFVAQSGDATEVRDGGITVVAERHWMFGCAEEIHHGEGDAGLVVIFEDGHVDDESALAGKNPG